MKAIDCQSFAGGFTLGMARAGFDVIAKRENLGGFGVPLLDHNRHLINDDIEIQVDAPDAWVPRRAQVVFGNPPCSGFSMLSRVNNMTGSESGAGHAINQCMWDLVRYAAACRPDVVVMESVQDAYKRGRELMQELRHEMEERTGKNYDLTHVLHNNAAVGGASIRRRYFMVLSRSGLKFGIEPPSLAGVTVLGDLLYDLETSPLKPGLQKYRRRTADFYALTLRSSVGMFDGHDTLHNKQTDNIAWIAEHAPEWRGGEVVGLATRRLLDAGIDLPASMRRADGSVLSTVISTDPYRARRAYAHKAAPVITGTGAADTVHPTLPRTLTFREAARIMGFPDDWSLAPILADGRQSRIAERQKWLGKGISVPCGEWIGGWVRAALNREPGAWRGTKLAGRNEWVIDVTHDHKAVYDERTGEQRDSRSKDLIKAMSARAAS